MRFPGLSAGKNVAEQVCLSGSCLPCCLSESWGRPLPQDCRAPGLCMYRVFFPGCSWIAVFWSMNFSYCFSAPLRWLHKRRGSPWAPRARSQRACYEEVWLCPYTLLAQVRSSDVLRGWFPCSGWWRVVLLPPGRHSAFPHQSALALTFTLWRSCQPLLCKSRNWMRQQILFWQTVLVFQAGLTDVALISFPWLCPGWRKTDLYIFHKRFISHKTGGTSHFYTQFSSILITKTFCMCYECVKRKCPVWFYFLR